MMIERKQECQNCNKKFEWFHQVGQNLFNPRTLDVEKKPEDKAPVCHVEEYTQNRLPLIVRVTCPKCGYSNRIEVKYND